MASSPPATPAEPRPLDRLQRAVAGWVGPVVYALPILEIWLLSQMDARGADALLIVLQAGWGVCFAGVLVICARRWHAPGPAPDVRPPAGPAAPLRPRTTRPAPDGRDDAHKLVPSSSARRTASRPSPRRRGDH